MPIVQTEGGNRMIVVKVRHSGAQEYLFKTSKDLKKGDKVIVETKYGESNGVCESDSFWVYDDVLEKLELVANYTLPLKKVVGVCVPIADYKRNEWVPVEDYPPMIGERVLVTTEEGAVMEAKAIKKGAEIVYYNARINIPVKAVAWMQWPKPYKVVENDEQ